MKNNQTATGEFPEGEPEKIQTEALETETIPLTETEAIKAEAEEYKRKWYSVTAEYENYRRRTALSKSQAYAEGRADVVKGLFPIADNLERALQSCAEENTRKGIEMVLKAFYKLLEDEKITQINPLGEEFDADKCEAIMAILPEEGEASGIIKQVYLKGYEQNGKVLRFAQVVVTK
ncbi:MAG: nucleotide exchange factor GrpE [Clostridia bacterium]|nr:nucleotide exchange factor GrpE [Clostridia bacterium]